MNYDIQSNSWYGGGAKEPEPYLYDPRAESDARQGSCVYIWGRNKGIKSAYQKESKSLSSRFYVPIIRKRVKELDITKCDIKLGSIIIFSL